MTDSERPADVTSVSPLPAAPRLSPRWVRRIVIGGAVAGAMAVAVPGLVWALAKRRKPPARYDATSSAE